jgi:fructokinase
MKRITSIGEILFDIYGTKKNFGGAPLNFIYHIQKIAGNANFVTAVGDDQDGRTILEFLEDHRFPLQYISIKKGVPTGNVLVKLSDSKVPQYQIKKNVAYDYISISENQKLSLIKNSGLIYFGTLCQRNIISRETIQSFFNSDLIKFCDLNLRQSFYTDKIVFDSLSAADILKLNNDELKVVCSMFSINSVKTAEAVKSLMKRFNIKYIAVTIGEDGAELFSRTGSAHYKVSKGEIIDTVGAGDAYSAILALGIINGHTIENINKLANEFASEVCSVKGALPMDEGIYESYRDHILNV